MFRAISHNQLWINRSEVFSDQRNYVCNLLEYIFINGSDSTSFYIQIMVQCTLIPLYKLVPPTSLQVVFYLQLVLRLVKHHRSCELYSLIFLTFISPLLSQKPMLMKSWRHLRTLLDSRSPARWIRQQVQAVNR